MAAVLAVVTTGPQLLMLVAYALIGDGPGGPLDYVVLVLRILAAGLVVSALYTALSTRRVELHRSPRSGVGDDHPDAADVSDLRQRPHRRPMAAPTGRRTWSC